MEHLTLGRCKIIDLAKELTALTALQYLNLNQVHCSGTLCSGLKGMAKLFGGGGGGMGGMGGPDGGAGGLGGLGGIDPSKMFSGGGGGLPGLGGGQTKLPPGFENLLKKK